MSCRHVHFPAPGVQRALNQGTSLALGSTWVDMGVACLAWAGPRPSPSYTAGPSLWLPSSAFCLWETILPIVPAPRDRKLGILQGVFHRGLS